MLNNGLVLSSRYFTHHPTTSVSPGGMARPLLSHNRGTLLLVQRYCTNILSVGCFFFFLPCVFFLKSRFSFRKYIKQKENFYMSILVKNTLATLFFLLFTNLCVVRHSAVEAVASGRVFFFSQDARWTWRDEISSWFESFRFSFGCRCSLSSGSRCCFLSDGGNTGRRVCGSVILWTQSSFRPRSIW